MIGILGGMGTQAGLDFCSKLAKLNRGKADQKYPLFVLYNKSNVPDRKQNLKKYNKVLKSLLRGCKLLEKNKCKFIVIPCNTAHYWFDDLQKKVNISIINMPKEKVDEFLEDKVPGENFNKFIVIKDSRSGPLLTWVQIGISDLSNVQVLDGLDSGDTVYILPSKSLVDYQRRFRERVEASFSFG